MTDVAFMAMGPTLRTEDGFGGVPDSHLPVPTRRSWRRWTQGPHSIAGQEGKKQPALVEMREFQGRYRQKLSTHEGGSGAGHHERLCHLHLWKVSSHN